MPITVATLSARAAELFGVPASAIAGPDRRAPAARARAAVSLAARRGGRSSVQVGHALGGRDHTTILFASERARHFARTDPDYRRRLLQLLRMAHDFKRKERDDANDA